MVVEAGFQKEIPEKRPSVTQKVKKTVAAAPASFRFGALGTSFAALPVSKAPLKGVRALLPPI